MSILQNTEHFLHKYLTFFECLSENDSFRYFEKFGIDVGGDTWNTDHSTFNWNKIMPHFQFFYDYVGNEKEVSDWLYATILTTHEHVIIRLLNEIIKIKTDEFINNWYAFVASTGFQGFELTTEDGKYFLEFTDDWKCYLNSNFKIKP